ncbi:MAG: PEGA domain-containing protein [Proteobacteria bacterium]|nr:PEGA domain-containing protein [Pseudomonadota bacterium]
MIFGTPEYMSPEQAQGHHPDHRVDIYAVGVIMYELLSGQVPFKADTFMGILTKHIFEEPVPPSRVNPDAHIPPEVEAIALKAMVKDRNHRYQSMAEMAAAIAHAPTRLMRPSGESQPAGASIVLGPAPVAVASSPGARHEHGAAATARTQVGHGAAADRADEDLALELPRRTRGPLYAVVAVALVGAALVIGWLRSGRPAGGQATVVVAPALPQIAVWVESEPSGARVLKGSLPIGQTPLQLTLPQSQRGVMLTFVRAGYETAHEAVIADAPGKRVRVTLQRQLALPTASPAPVPAVTPRARATPSPRRGPRRAPRTGRRRAAPMDDLINPFE